MMRCAFLAVGSLWLAAGCATVAPAPPQPPIVEMSNASCDPMAKLDAAIDLTPQKPHPWQDVSTPVNAATPCLNLEGGAQGHYIVYRLPSHGPNHVVTIGGAQEGLRILAPSVTTLDESGGKLRSFPPERYMILGDAYAVQFKPTEGEKYVLVNTNPDLVGRREHAQAAGAGPTGEEEPEEHATTLTPSPERRPFARK